MACRENRLKLVPSRQGVAPSGELVPASGMRPVRYGTGQGFACQISAAYSAIVRSLENLPELATFRIALRAQPVRVGVELDQPPVRLEVGGEVGQVHVVVAVGQQGVAERIEDPGSCGLKWSEKIRSRAARVSGSLS